MAKISKSRLEQRGQLEVLRDRLERLKWSADGICKNITDLFSPMDSECAYTLTVHVGRLKAHVQDFDRNQREMVRIVAEIERLEAELGNGEDVG